jgi:tyrosine-protein phosphatase non-receptor type 1
MLETGVISAAASRPNMYKSRYSNIMPFDSHRVVLKTSPATATDFINASHIVFPALKEDRIIATQGPLHPDWHGPNTCGEPCAPADVCESFVMVTAVWVAAGDFWRCAWENDVSVIVGLAKVQKGFSGSAPYWPTGSVGASVAFDEFTIVLQEETELSTDVVQRRLIVSNSSGELRPMLHLHYQSWPNYGVPGTTDGLRVMLNAVEKVGASVNRFGAFLLLISALLDVNSTVWSPETPQSVCWCIVVVVLAGRALFLLRITRCAFWRQSQVWMVRFPSRQML